MRENQLQQEDPLDRYKVMMGDNRIEHPAMAELQGCMLCIVVYLDTLGSGMG